METERMEQSVRIPGTKVDMLLAPRTAEQQRNFEEARTDIIDRLPASTTHKAAILRKIPIAGELAVRVLMSRIERKRYKD